MCALDRQRDLQRRREAVECPQATHWVRIEPPAPTPEQLRREAMLSALCRAVRDAVDTVVKKMRAEYGGISDEMVLTALNECYCAVEMGPEYEFAEAVA